MRPAARDTAIWCFAALFLLGLALRLYGISGKPFWMDEVTTIKRAAFPPSALILNSVIFHQLPSFFLLESPLLRFGRDEFWMRLLPACCGALSCALCFGIARELKGVKAGLMAGLLVCFSPAMVQHGQEARSYTMVICAILLGLWGLVRLAREETSSAGWISYTLGTAAALNVLGVALFWFLAANLAGAILLLSRDRRFRRNWIIAQLLVLLVSLPWYVAMKLLGDHGAMGGLNWVPPLDWPRIWWAFSGTYLLYVTSLIEVQVFPPAVPGLGWVAAAMAIAGLVRIGRERSVLTVLLASVLTLPAGLLLVSLFNPVLMPRYLLWSAAPWFICAGIGLTMLPERVQWPAMGVLTVLLAVNLAPYYTAETKPRWDLAGAELMAQWRPGDLLLVDDPQAVSMMNLYLRRSGEDIRRRLWTKHLSRAEAWQRAGGTVWAVQGPVGQVDRESQAQFLARIAPLGPAANTEHAGADILLLRFPPRPSRIAEPGATPPGG